MNNRLVNPDRLRKVKENQPWMVSLISGKGGVGKSVIAFNLAMVAADAGQRCLLLDADWYFGNQHILANVIPEFTLADVIDDYSAAKRAVISINNNLHLIASPAAGKNQPEFVIKSFASLMANLRGIFDKYDFIIVDTPSGIVDLINLTSNASDMNLIVLIPELTSIADSFGLFKYLVKSNSGIAAHILSNRVQNRGEYEYIYQKLVVIAKNFLDKIPYDGGYLPEDKGFIESVAFQKPLLELISNSPAGEALHTLLHLLLHEKAGRADAEEIIIKRNINSPLSLADIKE